MKYTWQCSECESTVVIDRKIAEMKNPPQESEAPCDCGAKFSRLIDAVAFNVPVGAYGGGKFHGKAWSKHVEKANLMVEKAKLPESKRKEVNDDIKKLEES